MGYKKRCSYCDEPGHNRRTCPEIREDKKVILEAAARRRKQMAHALEEEGIVPGALVDAELSLGWDTLRCTYIVRSINLGRLVSNRSYSSQGIRLVRLDNLTRTRTVSFLDLPIKEGFGFLPRQFDIDKRYSAAEFYRSHARVMRLVAPSKGVLLKKQIEDIDAYSEKCIFKEYNIVPKSYRAEDKRRLNHSMTEINDFINT